LEQVGVVAKDSKFPSILAQIADKCGN